jgi:siroheme synthase
MARGIPAGRPVAVIENASLPGETQHLGRLDQLGALAARLGSGPAIIVLGEVLRERLALAQTVSEAAAVAPALSKALHR